MDNSIERRLQRLEDRENIRELTATYCFLVDDGRYDDLVDLHFTDDAGCDFRTRSGDLEPFVSKGSEEVRAFFKGVVANMLRDMSHTVHNHRIVVEGDGASGECYFELTARDAASGAPIVGAGRYIDRYRRVENRWRFEQRNADIFHMVALAEGW